MVSCPYHSSFAVDDHARFDEAGDLFVFIPGLADRDRVPQQRPGPGRGQTLGLSASLVGLSGRSMVAPEIISNYALTAGLIISASSSPKA